MKTTASTDRRINNRRIVAFRSVKEACFRGAKADTYCGADPKPLWGWRDDTIEIMRQQIDYCADHDIAFWAFDWYYPEAGDETTPLNNAIGLYLQAPNCQRLKFCLLVANHQGFRNGGGVCSPLRRSAKAAGWTLPEPIIVRAGDGFVAVPEEKT